MEESAAASQVFVGGTAGVNKKELRDHFEAYGRVLSVRLAYDRAGRRRGFGFIRFEHATSAQQASLVGLQHKVAGQLVTVQPMRQNSQGAHTRQTKFQHCGSTFSEPASLLDVLHQVPTLPRILNPDSKKALSATCKSCRLRFTAEVQVVTIERKKGYAQVFERRWPRLCMVILLGGPYALPPSNLTRIITLHVSARGNNRATIFMFKPLHNIATDLPWTPLAAQQLAHQMRIRWPTMGLFEMSRVHDLDGLGLEIVSQLAKGVWTQMAHLTLSGCELNAKGFLLLSQGNWPRLNHLDISGNCLDAEGLAFLVKGNWPLLKDINLSFSPTLDANAIAHLSATNWLINGVAIGVTPCSADMAAALANLQLPNLIVLELRDSGLTAAAVSELAKADWPDLIYLNLHLALGDDDLVAVALLLGLDAEALKSIACDSVSLHQQRTVSGLGVALWPNLSWVGITHHHVQLADEQDMLTDFE